MAAYQPIQMPGGSGDFMGDVIDRIMRARAAQQAAEEHRAEMLLKTQALQQSQQLQGAQIENYQSEARHRTALEGAAQESRKQERLGEFDNVTKQLQALAQTDPAAAADIARRHGIENWQAHQPEPPKFPDAPVPRETNLPTGLELGPRRDPMETLLDKDPAQAEAERLRFEQANDPGTNFAGNRQANQDAATANQQDQKTFGDAKAAYVGKSEAFRREMPTYTGEHREFGAVNVDPNAPERARRAETARTREALSPLTDIAGLPPARRAQVDAAIAAGATRADALSMVNKEIEGQRHDDQDAKFKLTAEQQMEKARMMANAMSRPASDKHGGMDPQVEGVVLRRQENFEKKVKDLAARHDLPADTKNFQRAISNVDSATSTNGVLQAAAQFGMARDITGGGGQSLSNKDVAMVAPRAGGIARLQAMAQRLIDGQLIDPAEREVLAEAIRHASSAAAGRIRAFQNDYNDTFMNDNLPWRSQLGDNYIQGTLRAYVPGVAIGAKGLNGAEGPTNPLIKGAKGSPKVKDRLIKANEGDPLDAIDAWLTDQGH